MISNDQKRLFFAVSLYPLLFFSNTPFKCVDPTQKMKQLIRSDSEVSDSGWNWGQKFEKGDDPYKCEILIMYYLNKFSFFILFSSIAL